MQHQSSAFSRRRSEHTDRNVKLIHGFFQNHPNSFRNCYYMVLPQTLLYLISTMQSFKSYLFNIHRWWINYESLRSHTEVTQNFTQSEALNVRKLYALSSNFNTTVRLIWWLFDWSDRSIFKTWNLNYYSLKPTNNNVEIIITDSYTG